MPIPPTLPRDPKQTPRTRRFLQKMAQVVFNQTLPLPIVPAHTLLGNPTASPATASSITIGTGLSFTGSTLNASTSAPNVMARIWGGF